MLVLHHLRPNGGVLRPPRELQFNVNAGFVDAGFVNARFDEPAAQYCAREVPDVECSNCKRASFSTGKNGMGATPSKA